ncbi:TlpA disulfide reductase family protein [Sediminibacterium sp.]|jgi:thiol-disulfide isomerase/thioredoxin|uniref:TlpA family protein disulfide reductase n=1 Tax=Sediminibacterium sp. TaxID=1917865 RepID=UPI0025CE8B4E|nr:TlpA disulfide reductase family protein [Sediminibacterium sp.]
MKKFPFDRIVLLLSLVSFSILLNAQFRITYSYLTGTKEDSAYYSIKAPYNDELTINHAKRYPYKIISFVKKDTSFTTVVYDIRDTTTAFIFEGLGHEIFVLPGGSVNIYMEKMEKRNGKWKLNDKYDSYWFTKFSYTGKNQTIYRLFDSVGYNTGNINFDFIGFKKDELSLQSFYDSITKRYNNRISYINTYCSKYLIPQNIKKLALAECWSAYIINLIYPIKGNNRVSVFELPSIYQKTLEKVSFTDVYAFKKTAQYGIAALDYIYAYASFKNNIKKNTDSGFVSFNQFIINLGYPREITEYLLAQQLTTYYNKLFPSFNATFLTFKKKFPKSKYTKGIDSLFSSSLLAAKPTFDSVLLSDLFDSTGVKFKFNALLRGKPILIDCWASWCGPCITEMPYSKVLEKKYGDKIDFIYLSFDKSNFSWLRKMRALNIQKNSYLLDNNFNSNFATYFGISSIPRYILIDKEGKLLLPNAPRPSEKKLNDELLKLF